MKWYKSKTNWTAISAIVTAIGGYMTGEMQLMNMIMAVVAGLGAIFLRQGVAKGPNA